jgi:SAM-dependent methyltransferase
MQTFRDHFSESSPDYARFRPSYPDALFDWMAAGSPALDRAWDCATGTGQAAAGLAARFIHVVATDASVAQLSEAARLPGISYVRSMAEASGLAAGSMDAIAIAQAVHWFDRPAFFAEAKRVARPGALVAAWTYWTLLISPEIDLRVAAFYSDVVGPFWPPERRLIERQYRDIEMPFTPVSAPDLAINLPMTLKDVAGYVGTWSSTMRYRKEKGTDPVPVLIDAIAPLWGNPDDVRETTWPLAIRAGRVPSL